MTRNKRDPPALSRVLSPTTRSSREKSTNFIAQISHTVEKHTVPVILRDFLSLANGFSRSDSRRKRISFDAAMIYDVSQQRSSVKLFHIDFEVKRLVP